MSSISSKKVAVYSLGCKVNSYETEVMVQKLKDAGCILVPFEEEADIYVVNTCSVTNIADRKSRQMLHRARKQNPEALIAAVGCYVQGREPEEVLSDGVDLVIGNEGKADIVTLLEECLEKGYHGTLCDISKVTGCEEMELLTTDEHTRAYIKIEDGCNQFCSYCIIPYVRGRVRSRRPEEIIKEVRALAEKGYCEIVLTGINMSAYGTDLGDTDLLDLVERLADIEGISRIRISSLEPRIVTPEFSKRLAGIKKVCPHFHLSLQSGCDRTLKRMNRHYDSGEYAGVAERLRRDFFLERGAYPALTTDVIVGFPRETEEDFKECVRFVDGIGFFETHIFKYSPRKGTVAAKLGDKLTEKEKTARSRVLLDLGEKNRDAYTKQLTKNREYLPELLVEEHIFMDGKDLQVGHTGEYIKAAVISREDLVGRIVKGHLTPTEYRDGGREICMMEDFEIVK